MEGISLQYIYLGAVVIGAAIFAWIISKDANKFTASQRNLSKIHNSIIYALSYVNENMLDNGRFIYIRNIRDKYNVNKNVYNTTNHARMLYSLYLCERELNIKGLAERRRESAKYFVDEYVKPLGFGRYAVISKPDEENLKCEKAKLSATAMALVAFSDLRPEKLFRMKFLKGWGNFCCLCK